MSEHDDAIRRYLSADDLIRVANYTRQGFTVDYGPPLAPEPPREPGTSDDAHALNRIQHMLRDPEWGVGMLEDIADIVRGTGREVEDLPDGAPTWDRH